MLLKTTPTHNHVHSIQHWADPCCFTFALFEIVQELQIEYTEGEAHTVHYNTTEEGG